MALKSGIAILKRDSDEILIESARWCGSWLCRLRGLQFRRGLAPGEAVVLAWKKESIAKTSIHMFFVFFPIAAVWINSKGRVTSAQLAKPWRPYYASPEPACYVIETAPDFLEKVRVGDELDFADSAK
jgi:uncharacterized membrane protein (UPF0127 family)